VPDDLLVALDQPVLLGDAQHELLLLLGENTQQSRGLGVQSFARGPAFHLVLLLSVALKAHLALPFG